MTTRSQYRAWRPEYTTSPAPTCTQLAGNVWGHICSGTATVPRLACYPWVPFAALPVNNNNERVFFSPAMICPPGWLPSTTRTTSLRDTASVSGDEDEWIPGETAITCCPSGFGASNSDGKCRLELKEAWTNTPCVEGSVAAETGTLTAQAVSRPYAQMLRLRYQESDLTQPLQAGDSGGLSTGSKAAIGVVVPVVVMSLVLGILFFWRRRKRQKDTQDSKRVQDEGNHDYQKAELDAAENPQPETGLIPIINDSIPQHVPYDQPAVTAGRAELESRQTCSDDMRDIYISELPGQISEDSPAELPTTHDNQSSNTTTKSPTSLGSLSYSQTTAVPTFFSPPELLVASSGTEEAKVPKSTFSGHNGGLCTVESSEEQRHTQLREK
ncbi:hypothetical protein BKA66DRAFT_444957 [Pyrenochaeta sp. MPI-SDFR-AT-0127]|nr:hypothetical protein BKA66DRAFT_444957 [Pyrenochaeta sp. MPI-SDFR-AT-0127]